MNTSYDVRKRVRVVSLDCWHANGIIYQAEGRTEDGRYVYVRYRRPWFSVGVGSTPDRAVENDVFCTDARPDHDPGAVTRATLEEWAGHLFEWPERIDGYDNEPPPG
jgi:hypothetical protein